MLHIREIKDAAKVRLDKNVLCDVKYVFDIDMCRLYI